MELITSRTTISKMEQESLRHQNNNSGINTITKEDVLKKFLDSKAKSPNKNELDEPKESSQTSGGNKNIIHGVHIPPKMLAHSLRKKENRYFYFSSISKFEGNIHDIPLSTQKPEFHHPTTTIEE